MTAETAYEGIAGKRPRAGAMNDASGAAGSPRRAAAPEIESLEDHVQRRVDEAPPLTDEQHDGLAMLLAP